MLNTSVITCRICGNKDGNRPFTGREMMFGLRETFDYVECVRCGCLQIAKIPEDLSKYYPSNYYSFQPPARLKILIKGPWLCDPFTVGTFLKRLLTFLPGVRLMPEWMRRARLPRDAAILEVGSGSGDRLVAMRQMGYEDLTGIDPFIRSDVFYPNGVRILKKNIRDMARAYDFIMMHHAFEHMPEQVGTLRDIRKILKGSGTLLIRIPVASSTAWKTYRENWMALDPPRHLYLHTPESLRRVATEAGFSIADIFYDSDFYQFVGSEQYVRDIPLRDPRSYMENKRHSIFTRAQLRAFQKQTEELNRRGLGDGAAFYLRPSGV